LNEPGDTGTVAIDEPGDRGAIGDVNISVTNTPTEAPREIGANEPRQPSPLAEELEVEPLSIDRTREPGSISMAKSKFFDGKSPNPTYDEKKGFRPGSPEWKSERISIVEVPRYRLQFVVPYEATETPLSSDDNSALEILTSEYLLNYSKSMLGSDLFAFDGLVLQNIEVKGEISEKSRLLSESSENQLFQSSTNSAPSDLGPRQQSIMFAFDSKFVYMHWTKIAWAIDLQGLSENLVQVSLSENGYLGAIKAMDSISSKFGEEKDFYFAQASDVTLIISPERTYTHTATKEEKEKPLIEKPNSYKYATLAFLTLSLVFALNLVRWRIKKESLWQHKACTPKDLNGNDDEFTINFSETDEWLEREGDTLKSHSTDDEVTLIFNSTHGDEEDGEEYSKEQTQLRNLQDKLEWALDYLIYDDDSGDGEEEMNDHREERSYRNHSESIIDAYNIVSMRVGVKEEY